MDRFAAPISTGGRRPLPRYLSKRLIHSVKFDELQRLRSLFPAILNGLPSDAYYPEENGSQPESLKEEVLQSWNAISSFAEFSTHCSLQNCQQWVAEAEQMYEQINMIPAIRLTGRSNNAHLDSLRGAIRLFAELAEIQL